MTTFRPTVSFFFSIFICFCLFGHTQCKKEIIENENYYYEGCINYEGSPEGEGFLKVQSDTQIQEYTGTFQNGDFHSGKLLIVFDDGSIKELGYKNYPNEILNYELYAWPNGDKILSTYDSGIKVKEVSTYGPGDQEGLVVERFYSDNNVTEISNIKNNRVAEDIIGDEIFIDVPLIESNNQFRIPVGFITKQGDTFTVPIQFDTGATHFLIGHKLYQDLKEKCEVTEINVKGRMNGVGSEIRTKYVRIESIKIGEFVVKNVIAIVPIDKDQNGNNINDLLIGVGFLKKFKDVEWSLNYNKMRFYK